MNKRPGSPNRGACPTDIPPLVKGKKVATMQSSNRPGRKVYTEADLAGMFSDAIAAQGYGDHHIPPDGDWHDFAFPDSKRKKRMAPRCSTSMATSAL
jgi:hypothetical protein